MPQKKLAWKKRSRSQPKREKTVKSRGQFQVTCKFLCQLLSLEVESVQK